MTVYSTYLDVLGSGLIALTLQTLLFNEVPTLSSTDFDQ